MKTYVAKEVNQRANPITKLQNHEVVTRQSYSN